MTSQSKTLVERSETKPWAEEEEGNSGGWWVGEQEVGGLNPEPGNFPSPRTPFHPAGMPKIPRKRRKHPHYGSFLPVGKCLMYRI